MPTGEGTGGNGSQMTNEFLARWETASPEQACPNAPPDTGSRTGKHPFDLGFS